MDSRLLVLATAALLDGWCGPVVVDCTGTPTTAILTGSDDWPEDKRHGSWTVVRNDCEWPDMSIGSWETAFRSAKTEEISLDLSRAECRDRVARVLFTNLYPGQEPDRQHNPTASCPWWLDWIERVPALADLDPNDDTRLPDGSRLVDALALAAVAREVRRG